MLFAKTYLKIMNKKKTIWKLYKAAKNFYHKKLNKNQCIECSSDILVLKINLVLVFISFLVQRY